MIRGTVFFLTGFILNVVNSSQLFSQRELTKDEILKYWSSSSDKENSDLMPIVDSDSLLGVRLAKLTDSLLKNNIDSVIILSTAFPGYVSTSKCDTGIFPVITLVIWNRNGETNIIKIRGVCLTGVKKSSSTHLFDFYRRNAEKLKYENFMPVISSARINKDSNVSYSMSWIDHEPDYSFYYIIGNDRRSFHFSRSFIENTGSLFHKYNLSLSAYHWWQIVKKEIDDKD